MRTILLVAAVMGAVVHAEADEGMWTLYDLPGAVYETMEREGCAVPYDKLYNDSDAIARSVVNFSDYCTGVVVSRDGLVFTNHHCGFEAIRRHSTPENDYMLQGFYASTLAEELPNEDMFVSFMVEQRDVTATLDSLGFDTLDIHAQELLVDSVENAWSKAVKASDPTLRVELKPFYEGNKYYVTIYRDFCDVRLVFAVPKSMGKYGGETDNWMWPRQTCDIAVFRIYADPETGGPATYSENNVPYHPASWARVATDGYTDGSFAMVLGYPGSTSRYISSYGIRQRRDAVNEPCAQVRGVKEAVMSGHMSANPAVRIMYDSKYAESSNYRKNAIGMNKCIDSTGLIVRKADYEREISRYVDSTGFLRGKLDLALLDSLYASRRHLKRAQTFFYETFIGTGELVTRAYDVHNGMEVKGPVHRKKKQYVELPDNGDEWDAALDKDVLAALMTNYRTHVEPQFLPDFYKTIDDAYGGDCARYVDYVYGNTMLLGEERKIYINKKSFYKDCGVAMGLDLTDTYSLIADSLRMTTDIIREQEKYLCAAKIRMEEDKPHYSDANFTMRLTHGRVGGYTLGGAPSGYYTTAESIVCKMDAGSTTPDYYAEPEMRALMSSDDFGEYRDSVTGQMHLCFLTDNDITGGNSGSPVFNGVGELIGLAFDGNWDSLAADIFFDTDLARCICVDIRYVMMMMDKWGHADRLLEELKDDRRE